MQKVTLMIRLMDCWGPLAAMAAAIMSEDLRISCMLAVARVQLMMVSVLGRKTMLPAVHISVAKDLILA